jgi:hypothetical protein
MESLESRQMLSAVTLNMGGDTPEIGNAIYVTLEGCNVVAYNGSDSTGTEIGSWTRADVTAFTVNGTSSADTLTLDYTNGTPLPTGTLHFSGNGGSDTLSVIGRADIGSTLASDDTTEYSGSITTSQNTVTFDSVSNLAFSNLRSLTYSTPATSADGELRVCERIGKTTRKTAFLGEYQGSKSIYSQALTAGGDGTSVVISGGSSLNYPTITINDVNTIGVNGNGSTANVTTNITGTVPAWLGDYALNFIGCESGDVNVTADYAAIHVAAGSNVDVLADSGAHLDFTGNEIIKSLTIDDATVSHVTSFEYILNIGTLSIGTSGLLDLHGCALLTESTSSATLHGYLTSGFGTNQDWTGTTGITDSTVAATNAVSPTSLGYGDMANMLIQPSDAFIARYGLGGSTKFVFTTTTADVTMDGIVDDDDITVVGLKYNPSYNPTVSGPMHWYDGDFNYNGIVDDDDVTILGLQYSPASVPPGFEINSQAPSKTVSFTGTTALSTFQLPLAYTEGDDTLHSWTVYWGDNSRSVVTAADVATLANCTLNHVYTETGTHCIVVFATTTSVFDVSRSHFVGMGDVSITEPTSFISVAAPAQDYPTLLGTPFHLNVTTYAGGTTPTSVTIDWGDSTTTTTDWSGTLEGYTHTYTSYPTTGIVVTTTDSGSNTHTSNGTIPQMYEAPVVTSATRIDGITTQITWSQSGTDDIAYYILKGQTAKFDLHTATVAGITEAGATSFTDTLTPEEAGWGQGVVYAIVPAPFMQCKVCGIGWPKPADVATIVAPIDWLSYPNTITFPDGSSVVVVPPDLTSATYTEPVGGPVINWATVFVSQRLWNYNDSMFEQTSSCDSFQRDIMSSIYGSDAVLKYRYFSSTATQSAYITFPSTPLVLSEPQTSLQGTAGIDFLISSPSKGLIWTQHVVFPTLYDDEIVIKPILQHNAITAIPDTSITCTFQLDAAMCATVPDPDNVSYVTVDWGDNHTSVIPSSFSLQWPKTVSHQYAAEGDYNIALWYTPKVWSKWLQQYLNGTPVQAHSWGVHVGP